MATGFIRIRDIPHLKQVSFAMNRISHLSTMLAVVVFSPGALAVLGRSPHTPEQFPAQVQLHRTVPANSLYTVHQTTLPTGTVVQEFASPSGQVFALTWLGPVLPDLSEFFGDYFPIFQDGALKKQAAGVRGGALLVQHPNLIVVSKGRMSHFEGHAYAPALVPASVVIQELLR